MPDPSTTRISLYKSKSDGSELVSYTQDIGQNWDKVDAAVGFQSATSSTRPSSPYSGKPIFETDTSYRTYFSNGTSPASGSWVEIPNGSAQFNSTLRLATGKQINVNSSASTATLAVVNATAGTDLISGRVTGDTVDRFLADTDGTLNWGVGGSTATDVNLYRSAANILKTDDAFTAALNVTVGGDLKLVNGATTYRNALSSGTTTVANTVTETVIATATIPASDAVVGAVYRMKAWGVASVTGTPTFTLTARLGGVSGASMGNLGPSTASSGVTAKAWTAEFELVCVTTGASGTWLPRFAMFQNINVTTVIGSNHQIQQTSAVTRDTTVSNAMVVTWTWGTANASNTATCQGVIFERVA